MVTAQDSDRVPQSRDEAVMALLAQRPDTLGRARTLDDLVQVATEAVRHLAEELREADRPPVTPPIAPPEPARTGSPTCRARQAGSRARTGWRPPGR